MASTQSDKLIRMANQIATFYASEPDVARRAPGVAEHINKFWDPRMREALLAMLDEGRAEGAHPIVLDAGPLIRRPRPMEGDALSMAKNSP